MTARSQSRPCASILAQWAGSRRMDRCTNRSASAFGGRPPLFLGCSMVRVYVMHKPIAKQVFM
jgi:hypothetical protein